MNSNYKYFVLVMLQKTGIISRRNLGTVELPKLLLLFGPKNRNICVDSQVAVKVFESYEHRVSSTVCLNLTNIRLQVSLEDFLESCRAPALLTELEDDDEADDALDSDKENEPTYQEVVSIVITIHFCFSIFPVMCLWCFDSPCYLVVDRIRSQ